MTDVRDVHDSNRSNRILFCYRFPAEDLSNFSELDLSKTRILIFHHVVILLGQELIDTPIADVFDLIHHCERIIRDLQLLNRSTFRLSSFGGIFTNDHVISLALGDSKKISFDTGALEDTFRKLCDVLGIILDKKEEVLDSEIEEMIAARQAARKAKDFAKADQIRADLLAKGIILEDTREGVKWKRA